MKIGSLCTGYGGLDMAVEAVFGAETVWVSEIDKYASILIDERIKKPNLGDLKVINWAEVEPIDILTAGYPCQPFSSAGYRKGTDDERHIFPYILEAISTLRPKYAIMENVRGHLSLGLKEVLQGLASIGYDAKWRIVRASDVGAPHHRARLFIIANPSCERRAQGESSRNEQEHSKSSSLAFDTNSNSINRRSSSSYKNQREMVREAVPDMLVGDRLNPAFVEYMMGLPKGWVTDLPILDTHKLKMLGNGVVPQQAEYAIRQILNTPSD